MDRLYKVMDELHEEVDAEADVLTPLAVGAVIERAAQMVVDAEQSEFTYLVAHLRRFLPNNPALELAIESAATGAHRRTTSAVAPRRVG